MNEKSLHEKRIIVGRDWKIEPEPQLNATPEDTWVFQMWTYGGMPDV